MEIMQYIEVELFSLIWMLKCTQYFMYNENIYVAYCEACAKKWAFKHMYCGYRSVGKTSI